ncbi:MAG: efflux RND transporter periplasmic adaptor subunit [Armatimonadetes bacterium]|nr:efflux RND transporter periplasmic adaptor subunit [Armatimonadota bacterium]
MNETWFEKIRWPEMPQGKRRAMIATLLGVLAGLLACYWIVSRQTPPVTATEEVLAVPSGKAGKAGDVLVTQEAMELAEIRTAPAELMVVQEKLEVSGTIQTGGDRIAKISPRASAKVVQLLAGVGDEVAAGQTLAVLESGELAEVQAAFRGAAARVRALESSLSRQRELARLGQFGRPQLEESRERSVEAQRGVQEAQRSLSEQRAWLAEKESEQQALVTEMEVQRSRLARAEALQDIVSRQELERIRADYITATARVAQGEARARGARDALAAAVKELSLTKERLGITTSALAREEEVFSGEYLTSRELVDAEAALRMAQVEMDSSAERVRLLGGEPGQGNQIPLVTPIAGEIQECAVTLGESVDPEHIAFTVINLDQVWAQLAVAPKDLARVKVGNPVELQADSTSDRVFKGRIAGVSPAADETTLTVQVRTTIDNPDAVLRAGAFIRGSVITDIRHQRLTVPEGALQEHTGRPTLYVVRPGEPGAFEVRHVFLGAPGAGWREVTEGLAAGEAVAVSGTFYLKSEALKSALSDGCCSSE